MTDFNYVEVELACSVVVLPKARCLSNLYLVNLRSYLLAALRSCIFTEKELDAVILSAQIRSNLGEICHNY